MQLLNSKNYESVHVHIRDFDDPIIMPVDGGTRLMEYITGELQTKHVKLTDKDGGVMVVAISDIRRVEPIAKLPSLEESMEKILARFK